ncbi:MAG: preprotein translocase subunit SecE [Gammaproteobacteria bacterium TMED78]|nr:MAG: preprotein translocase subunit SecE [Gammaproteobacteria bacterium TMED78]|tara:strand:- start:340 stop:711 length:372 start_codon:yes stop_codon:yes gene_type:complete
MDIKQSDQNNLIEIIKLSGVLGVFLVGMIGFYYLESGLYSAILLLISFILGILLLFQTERGRLLKSFIEGSRVELRKVVWPTREETIQTTIMVLIFAMIMGIFFWLLDMFLLWLTRFLTGQGV